MVVVLNSFGGRSERLKLFSLSFFLSELSPIQDLSRKVSHDIDASAQAISLPVILPFVVLFAIFAAKARKVASTPKKMRSR